MIDTTAPNEQTMRELREHERVELVPSPMEPKQIPLWVYTNPQQVDASSGLVMNLSHSGLQVMTGPGQLTGDHYEVRLMLGEGADDGEFSGPIRRVWSRQSQHQDFGDSELSGFEFEHPDSPAEQFLRRRADNSDQDGLVRCVLVARKMIGSFVS